MKYEPLRCEIWITWLAFHTPVRRIYRDFADALLLKGHENVMDFGSGLGTVARFAAKKLRSGHLCCVDISQRWLAACRRTLKSCNNVSYLQGEVYRFGLPPRSFDVIYCHFVLHDIPDARLQKAVPALAALLKEGGRLIFREPIENASKVRFIQTLLLQCGLKPQSGRIIRIALMGSTLESVYSMEALIK